MVWTKLPDPVDLPPGTGAAVAFNPDDTVCAIGSYAAPYLTLYDTTTSPWTKMADPDDFPPGAVEDLQFSPDGSVLAVTCYSAAPYHILYDTSDWSKMADLADPPPSDTAAVRFSPDGTYLAFAHYTAPCFAVYNTSDWSKLSDPAVGMANDGNFVAWSPDGTVLVVGTTFDDNTAVLAWYDTATWTRHIITAPDSENAVWAGCFTTDGATFAVISSSTLALYDTSDWSRRTDPADQPSTPFYYVLDYSEDFLLVGYTNFGATPYLLVYAVTDYTTPIASPVDAPPTGGVDGVSFSHDGLLAGVAHDGSPYFSVYALESDTDSVEVDLTLPSPELESLIFHEGQIEFDATLPPPSLDAMVLSNDDDSVEQEWIFVEANDVEQEWILDSHGLEFVEQEWELPSAILEAIEQEWQLPSDILATDELEVETVFVSPIATNDAQVITVLPTITIRGQVIPLEQGSVTDGEGQFAWTCQLTLQDPRHFSLFRADDDFTVNLPGEDYAFIVDNIDRDRSGQVDVSVTISGSGPAMRFAQPRAQRISKTWDEPILATAVVAELFGDDVVQWEILDWTIPAFRLGVEDLAPMDILKKIADAAGAVVCSEPDGTIRVRYLYPVSIPQFESATPDQEYFDAPHTFKSSSRVASFQIVNKLRLLEVDVTASRDTIEFEQDQTNFAHGKLRVFPKPWRFPVRVEHTSDNRVSASIVGERTEELTETIEILGGKGSVSHPINTIVSLEWLYVDLLGVVFDPDATEFTTTHPTLKESLLTITYTTRFIEFNAAAFQDAEVQFLVREAA